MALRLVTALRTRASLLHVRKIQTAPLKRTLLMRKNLVPFLDDDPCVFSAKALRHHWGAIPILVISTIALAAKIMVWIIVGLTRHDVSFTKNSAFCDQLETRHKFFYPAKYLKFYKINQKCEVPDELLKAKLGDAAGPPIPVPEDGDKKGDGDGSNVKGLIGHAVLSGVALGLAATL
ncbi:uncharacterized protein LOC108116606 isoform X1 [Drosophila eugracilis]|uniref:uncharacterized protein LOC108116606 isoform X1 n=1 Tax=Drosophila eugracilis TaxID=29029 RepID=UPI001BDA8C26|nr:uncharacterized protein LOC108116606 isoform X1 [Drosophila eugracilis]